VEVPVNRQLNKDTEFSLQKFCVCIALHPQIFLKSSVADGTFFYDSEPRTHSEYLF